MHVEQLKIVPDVDRSRLRLTVVVRRDRQGMPVEAVALAGGAEVARAAVLGEEITVEIPKEKLKLWSPEEPFLYDLAVSIKQGGKTIDEVRSYFGMRKIDLGRDGTRRRADAAQRKGLFSSRSARSRLLAHGL